MVRDFLASALKGAPTWAYVHGGRAFHARRAPGDRVAVCGVQPQGRGTWRGGYQLRIITVHEALWLRRRHECSRCRRLLRVFAGQGPVV